MTTFNWLIVFVCISHVIKILLNWDIYNQLNPKKKAKISINYPGKGFTKRGRESIVDDNLFFMYCCFVFFWVKIPKNPIGRGMAWSVLIISILQIGALIVALNYFAPKPNLNIHHKTNLSTEYDVNTNIIDQESKGIKRINWNESKREKITEDLYQVYASNDSIKFIITVERFDSLNHSFTLNKDESHYLLIDSAEYYGIDKGMTLPSSLISNIEIIIHEKPILIPSSKFKNLFDPNLHENSLHVFYKSNNDLAFSFGGSDGAGSFYVTYIIRNNLLKGDKIECCW